MLKLSDTQAVLLSHAAGRDSGSLHPLPQTLRRGSGTSKALAALVSAGLAQEGETIDAAAVHRSDGDLRYGLFVTAAGLAAIGVVEGEATAPAVSAVPEADAPPEMAAPARITKTSAVLALLQRDSGATLPELIAVTGWLPHTTRAALTGLRKKGHVIMRGTRDGTTCYRVVAA